MDKIATPTKTREILNKYGIRLSKRRGQNFLVDPVAAAKIASNACSEGDYVVEIGPGIGALTQMLLQRAKKLVAIEIDPLLVQVLREEFKDFENLTVIEGDALDFNLDALAEKYFSPEKDHKGYKIVGNLPYYVTTPILFHIFETASAAAGGTVMLQKEVADRISACPGSKAYGSLSVASQYYSEPKVIAKVSHRLFFPQPEVESVVLKLEIRDNPPVNVRDPQLFFTIVRAAFNQRRKTVVNALSNLIPELSKEQAAEILSLAGILPSRRGETLDIADFARVANAMFELMEEEED